MSEARDNVRIRPGTVREIGILIAIGLVITVAIFFLIKFCTTDLRWVLLEGVALCWVAGFFSQRFGIAIIFRAILGGGPLALVFYLLVTPELPSVWFVSVVYLLASLIGATRNARLFWAGTIAIVIGSVLVAGFVIPKVIESDLFVVASEEAPQFTLMDLTQNVELANASLKGKIVVLDFFGNWCVPCIKSIPELEKAFEEFPGSDKVVFLSVCTGEGGDTPDDALKFRERYRISFDVCFDEGGKAHRAFRFSGVPGVLILDGSGSIRLRHEGFNPAEDLSGNLVRNIRRLLEDEQ